MKRVAHSLTVGPWYLQTHHNLLSSQLQTTSSLSIDTHTHTKLETDINTEPQECPGEEVLSPYKYPLITLCLMQLSDIQHSLELCFMSKAKLSLSQLPGDLIGMKSRYYKPNSTDCSTRACMCVCVCVQVSGCTASCWP